MLKVLRSSVPLTMPKSMYRRVYGGYLFRKTELFLVHFCSYIETDQKTQGKIKGFLPNSLKMKEKRTIRSN